MDLGQLFMVLFSRYAPQVFPPANTLDNFYAIMLDEQKAPLKIHHPDNPPLFAWAERELFHITGDLTRLKTLLVEKKYLQRMFALFENSPSGTQPEWGNCPIELQRDPDGYRWAGCPSGMDNTPRGDFNYDKIYWLDAMAQQALSAKCISDLAAAIYEKEIAAEYAAIFAELKLKLNRDYWDTEDAFYYDRFIDAGRGFCKVKTPASFWPLLAEVSEPEQIEGMVAAASDEQIFGGPVPYPAVARSSSYYEPKGLYMQSGVWLPLVYLSTKALDTNNHHDLGRINSVKMLDHMLETYRSFSPASIWECYAPELPKPSTVKDNEGFSRPEFCGWSALGPISLFIEDVLGFYPYRCHKQGPSLANRRGTSRD